MRHTVVPQISLKSSYVVNMGLICLSGIQIICKMTFIFMQCVDTIGIDWEKSP